MKLNKLLRAFALTALLGSVAVVTGSCSDDETDSGGSGKLGQITGVVKNDSGATMAGVAVTVSDLETTATTGADGSYTLTDIPASATHVVTFTKQDYQTTSITVTAHKYSAEGLATVNALMEYAAAKIKGTVTDANNNGAPLAGVTVSLSATQTAVTGADGTYIIENLPLSDYDVTFTLLNYATKHEKVKRDAFVDGLATINMRMGGSELLRGLTADDLRKADKWSANEYRGGKGNGGGALDWSTTFMSALDFRNTWENQNEGVTIQIRNGDDDKKNNPADLKVFDSFVFGSKMITEDNKIMTLMVRTHSASDERPCYWGVQVVDLSVPEPKTEMVGEVRTLNSGSYVDREIDLSAYVGKEVVLVIGTFRPMVGDYWEQFVIRHMSFAAEKNGGDNYLPGDEVVGLEKWHMTQQMLRSTMPQTKKSFTGVSDITSDIAHSGKGYSSWRGLNHIAAEWAFMYVNKDAEPHAGQGFVIKTRGGGTPVSTLVPESYFYAKFAIAAGTNSLTFKTRTFGGGDTFFKVSAITEAGVIKHLTPAKHTAARAAAADNGCWRFNHDKGEVGKPGDYASFVYDLSEFNGQNVMLTIGVFKGEDNGDESKLVFYSVDLK
ncbi:MAG: carboxypeptidase-like regulatory domain-containing protein [Alistipes sp.]